MLRTAFVITSSMLLLASTFSSGTLHESKLSQADLTPLAPQAGADTATSSAAQNSDQPFITPPASHSTSPAGFYGPDYPVGISIPSIHLDDHVQGVGVTSDGAMDVPDGKTRNVGWYAYGTMPGYQGSAVMDAHVFAAFKNLRYVKIGQEIRVTMASGRSLRYIVTASMLYPYNNVPLQLVFNRSDGSYLNLITCAGHLTADHSTYTERLVVYAKLAP